MKKKSSAMTLVLMSILFLNSNIQSLSITDQSNQSYNPSAKITDLKINHHSWIIDFFATIKISNPSNSSIKINQSTSCGFSLTITAYTDYGSMGGSVENSCSQTSGSTLYPFTYQPGTTTEFYNGSVSLLFTFSNTSELLPGFYFFDIENYYTQYVNNVAIGVGDGFQTINALYVYYGGGKGSIQYNESSPDTLPYGSLPISKQLSLFSESAPIPVSTTTTSTSTNNTNTTPIQNIFNFMFNNAIGIISITGIVVVSVFVFINYRKKHPTNRIISNPFRTSVNNPIYLSRSQDNQIQPKENYEKTCIHCHNPINKDDVFCAKCGQKIL